MLVLSVAGTLCTAGCKSFGPLTLTPVKTERVALEPQFSEGFYRVTQDHTYRFYLQTEQRRSPKKSEPVKQIAIINVFWRPIPGVTPILSSAINATIRYIVITPGGVGMYQGAGFVRLFNSRGARIMHGAIIDGDLRLTGSSGYFKDALGPCRIRGDFRAIRGATKEIALSLRARRRTYIASFRDRAR
ncbi:MAG: hypothetical protein ACP5O1_02695 [Phycisphaerae bacterium]